jgi:hypothetical protein
MNGIRKCAMQTANRVAEFEEDFCIAPCGAGVSGGKYLNRQALARRLYFP